MSSTTAAPSRLKPTRLRSAPNSIRVRAEILTLVAASASPNKKAAAWLIPKARPANQPNPIEKRRSPVLAIRDTLRFFVNSPRCRSRPAMNINNSTPNSLNSEMVLPRVALLIKGRPRDI